MTHLPFDYFPYFLFIRMKVFNESQKCFFIHVNNQHKENQHRFFSFGQVLSTHDPNGQKLLYK
jgi:hypothetical protein